MTGADGFVGRWLVRELEVWGHDALGLPPSAELDITNREDVQGFVERERPDAIAHLAGVSFGPDARRDPDRAMAVNAGGTQAVVDAAAVVGAAVLVVSSADVYGVPDPADLPLSESAPLLADHPYGRSKLAQEAVARAAAGSMDVVVVRPFNHIGPGQRREFVVPALAARIVAARQDAGRSIRAGNVDVRRDFCDVRDVVRGYRMILERLGGAGFDDAARPQVFNIASGRSVRIRDIAGQLAALAGIDVEIVVDPELVRATDPAEIRGDASRMAAELGWRPTIPLETTLGDIFAEVAGRAGVAH